MGRPRLPWIKLHVARLDEERTGMLSDALFATWVRLYLHSAQQPERWCFSSAEHAAYVSRRPVNQVRELVKRGLLEEMEEGMLRIVDAEREQKATERGEVSPEFSPSISDLFSANGASIGGVSGEKTRTEGEGDKELTPLPPSAEGAKKRRQSPKHEPLTHEQHDRIVEEYAPKLGAEVVEAEIEAAMNHSARLKAFNEALYVRTWLRRVVPRQPVAFAPRNGYVNERIGPAVILDD